MASKKITFDPSAGVPYAANLTIFGGANFSADFTVVDTGNAAYNFTGWTGSAQLAKSVAAGATLGAQATFVARTIDRWQKHMAEMMERSYHHDGGSFIEIYQNCNIFNDGAFEEYTGKEKLDNVIELKHGEPMLFSNGTKGIKLDGSSATVVEMEKYSLDEILVHDETNLDLAHIIANWTTHPILPEPIGVIYSIDKPTYNQEIMDQVEHAKKVKGVGNVQDLLNAGDTWVVK